MDNPMTPPCSAKDVPLSTGREVRSHVVPGTHCLAEGRSVRTTCCSGRKLPRLGYGQNSLWVLLIELRSSESRLSKPGRAADNWKPFCDCDKDFGGTGISLIDGAGGSG